MRDVMPLSIVAMGGRGLFFAQADWNWNVKGVSPAKEARKNWGWDGMVEGVCGKRFVFACSPCFGCFGAPGGATGSLFAGGWAFNRGGRDEVCCRGATSQEGRYLSWRPKEVPLLRASIWCGHRERANLLYRFEWVCGVVVVIAFRLSFFSFFSQLLFPK